jgi:hypothetical protein
MKLFVITMIALSAFAIPVAFADTPYIFVQIIHRDSDGNLISYLQSDKMTSVDLPSLDFLLDHESSIKQDPIYEIDGKKLQVITRQFTDTFDSQNLYASTELLVNMNSIEVMSVRFLHDGFRVTPGDTVTTVWSFSRLV